MSTAQTNSNWTKVPGVESGIYERNGRYRFYKVPQTFDTVDDAVRAKYDFKRREEEGKPQRNPNIQNDQILDECLLRAERRLQGVSMDQYRRESGNFRGWLAKGRIRIPGPLVDGLVLEKYFHELAEGKVTGNLRSDLTYPRLVVNDFCNMAVRQMALDSNPMQLVEMPKRQPRAKKPSPSRVEREQIDSACRKDMVHPKTNPAHGAVIGLLNQTPTRGQDALGLRQCDVSGRRPDGGRDVTVRGAIKRKDRSYGSTKSAAGVRTLRVSGDATESFLEPFLDPDAPPQSYLYRAQGSDRPLAHSQLDKAFRRILKAAGLEDRGFTIHSLRHGSVSALVHSGMSPAEVAHLTGHSNPEITLRTYSHVYQDTEEMLDQSAQALSFGPPKLKLVEEEAA